MPGDVITTIVNIIAYAISALLFLFLCMRNKKINLKPENRYRQLFMPAFALTVSIVLLALYERVGDWVYSLISFLLQKLAELVSKLSPDIGDYISTALDRLLNIVPVNILRLLFVNIVAMILYLILKRIVLGIASLVLRGDNSDTNDAGALKRAYLEASKIIYEYDDVSKKRYLMEEHVDFRTFLSVIYAVSVLVSVIAFAVCLRLMIRGMISSPIYPVVVVILIGELYFIFGGISKKEALREVSGEDDDFFSIINFMAFQRILHQVFGDKSVAYDINTFNLHDELSTGDLLVEIKKSDDRSLRAFANFLSSQVEAKSEIDRNVVASVIDLIQGKSVLFSNPFYQDLSPYIFYPLNRSLLKKGKALVICGRHGIEDKIADWVGEGVAIASNTEGLWRIANMRSCNSDTDIGILSADDICTVSLREECREFFKAVRYAIIIEPSKLITTGQIGLNAIVREIGCDDVTYCACDKVCDGLVDALSHALLVNMTEVAPARLRDGLVAYSIWNGDNEHLMRRLMPSISRYLGTGTELSFLALKNQIKKAEWFGGEAFPVADMHWITSQYLQELADYANISPDMKIFSERFVCNSDMWSAKITRGNYVIVEDEAFNLFESYNNFSSRSVEQGYVNVVSPQYLLRDYMADNKKIFASDRKAIPLICGDFARTERNIILRLILMLTSYEVSVDKIERELAIISAIAKKQEVPISFKEHLWYYIVKGVASAEIPLTVDSAREYMIDEIYGIDILKESKKYSLNHGKNERVIFIEDTSFADRYASTVKTADYITEGETGDYTHIGSELYGHVFQKYLPGQKMTYSGKYYEMLRETVGGKILLRRAADHITERMQYQQIRKYTIASSIPSELMGDSKTVDNIRISAEYADFSVKTQAYYEMNGDSLLSGARLVEVSGVPDRIYRNKRILKIELAECTAEIRFTLAVLMNEIFVTLFAENRVYICAATEGFSSANDKDIDQPDQDKVESEIDVGAEYVDIAETTTKSRQPLYYSIDGKYDKNAIYIFEDSDLDIGLLDALERNIRRIFSIATDYLAWHNEKLKPVEEPEVEIEIIPDEDKPDDKPDDAPPKKKKANIFRRIWEKIKSFFRRKKKPGKSEQIEVEDTETETATDETPETPETNETPETPETDETNETDEKDKENEISEIIEESETPKTDELSDPPMSNMNTNLNVAEKNDMPSPLPKAPYEKSCYLQFGYSELPKGIDIVGTYDYLVKLGYKNNYLFQARHSEDIIRQIERTYKPFDKAAHLCDFCACEISNVSFDLLSDGRERCAACSKTAITKAEDFIALFNEILRDFECIYNIKISVPVKVRMTNAKKIAKEMGTTFVATPGFNVRAIGLAVENSKGHTLLIEGGAPRLTAISTIAHELTHIWQYANWNRKAIIKSLGKDGMREFYEGMAVWAEIQFMMAIGEPVYAKRQEIISRGRNDEYGRGFLKYIKIYPFAKTVGEFNDTPFLNASDPLKAGKSLS